MVKQQKPAISYERFSTIGQAEGDSIRRQDKMRDEWLAQHPEYYLDEEILDDGISSFRGKNAAKGKLSNFLKACKSGRIAKGALLIIESHDRLTRMPLHEARRLWEGIIECGVDILNQKSGRNSTRKDLEDPTACTIAVWEIYAAHEYSKQLSRRLKSVWAGRREDASQGKMVGICPPKWIARDGDKWELVQDKVKTVQRIFRLAAEGKGLSGIVQALNDSNTPTFRYAELWSNGSVHQILTSRTVLGELQMYLRDGSKREPVGDPIPSYYPAIIEQDLFDKAQAGLAARKNRRGPRGRKIANLFTGLVFHAVDGKKVYIRHRGKGKITTLASSAKIKTAKQKTLEFKPEPLEEAVLTFLSELRASDINGHNHSDTEEELETLITKLTQLEKNIASTAAHLEDADDDATEVLLQTQTQLGVRKTKLKKEIAALQQELVTAASVDLHETQRLVEQLQTIKGDKLIDLREKLKHRIAQLVSEIWILPVDLVGEWIPAAKTKNKRPQKGRVAYVQIFLRSGGVRALVACSWDAAVPGIGTGELIRDLPEDRDLRNYRDKVKGKQLRANPMLCLGLVTSTSKLSKREVQATHRQIRKLHKEGKSNTEIATAVGVSVGTVQEVLGK